MKHYFKKASILALFFIFSCGKDDDNPPTNTAPVVKTQSFNFSEDLGPNNIIGKVVASDPDGDALTYSITTNDNALFEIASNADLSLVAGASLDYETATSHTITVTISDGELSSSAQITINVVNVDENVAPVIAAQSFDIAENLSANAVIANIVATDANGNAILYSITQNAFQNGNALSPMFEFLDNTSGELRLSPNRFLDFEQETSYVVTVEVTDGVLSAAADITINVTNVDEAPAFTDGSNIDDVAEDIDDTVVIGTLAARDPEDGNALNWQLITNPNNLFELTLNGDNNAEISLVAGKSLDYETATSHIIAVRIKDSSFNSVDANFTINVTDIAESGIMVSTFAGSTKGDNNDSGTAAQFDGPTDISIDANGNLYITDSNNRKIKKINAAGGVSTFAGSGNTNSDDGGRFIAGFSSIFGLAFNNTGTLYVVDAGNRRIRAVDTNGTVSTLAGSSLGFADGTGTAAQFNNPNKICIDVSGNLYVSDTNNHRIRKVTPAGVVTTIAGGSNVGSFADGTGTAARFNRPRGITIDSSGNLYVVDEGNDRIRKITPAGVVTTLAGSGPGFSDGIGTAAKFDNPNGITIDSSGNLYVTDIVNRRVRKVTSAGVVTTVAGTGSQQIINGDASTASFDSPGGIAIDSDGNLYVTETLQHLIRKITF